MKSTTTMLLHIRRSPYQSFAAVLSMFLTMLLISIFTITTAISSLILRYFESKPQLTVFFAEKTSASEAETLKTTLEATGKVASMKFVSQDDALVIYKEQNKDDPLLLEMVTADILPASLEVIAKEPQFLKDLEPIIKQTKGIDEVVFQKDVVETLLSWTNALRIAGGIFAGLLAINTILIVTTVIGMKLAIRKDEIEILKLIGAAPWYIRFPFILEGGLYGVVGAVSAWIVIVTFIIIFRTSFLSFLGIVPVIHDYLINPFMTMPLLTAGGFLIGLTITGWLLGAVGSMVAVGRYIK